MIGSAFRHGADHPYRVLCLGAHPDDVEIGCGGTLLRIAMAYPRACFRCVVFSGTPERAEEARRAAHDLLGESELEVAVHGFRDGFFPHQGEAIKEVFEHDLKLFAPDLVLTHYRHDRHQDHRVLSDLAWNTFRRHLVVEYEVLKYDGDLGQPNLYVPLPEPVVERKVEVLMARYASQRSKHWFTEDTFRALLRVRGVECAHPFAEAFHARKLVW